MRQRPVFAGIVVAGLAVLTAPRAASALGTCGKGGVTGAHVNVKFSPSEYWVWAPAADPMKAYPLVLAFHGDEGTPEDSMYWFWDPVWMKDPSFILVTPRADTGHWTMPFEEHIAWVDKLVAELAAKYNVDVDRIYATGASAGSILLAHWGLARQKTFAAIQWSCGGDTAIDYAPPPRDDCKTAGRFVISKSDFIYSGAEYVYRQMMKKGHDTEWVDAACSGHCCGPNAEYGQRAWDWFKKHTHCAGATTGPGCGMIGDLPGAAPTPDAGSGGAGGGGGSTDGGGPGGSGAGGGGAGGGGNGGDNGGGPGGGGGGGGKPAVPGGEVSAGCAYGAAGETPASTLLGLLVLAACPCRRRPGGNRGASRTGLMTCREVR